MKRLAALLTLAGASFAYRTDVNYCQPKLPTFNPPKEDLQLAQLAVVTRHGDRAPLVVLPREIEALDASCVRINVVSRG